MPVIHLLPLTNRELVGLLAFLTVWISLLFLNLIHTVHCLRKGLRALRSDEQLHYSEITDTLATIYKKVNPDGE